MVQQLKTESNAQLLSHDSEYRRIMDEAPESIDGILSRELYELSLKDRTRIDEEIHGVAKPLPPEPPEFLELALLALSKELDAIPDEDPVKSAYHESQVFHETYVNTAGFRLRFLRCERFDARKAAIRMVKFLDVALELFGPPVLKRPVRVSDFGREELKVLAGGYIQIFPYRDRTGRTIFAWVGDFGHTVGTPHSRNKATLYLYWALTDDVACQREGVTMLIFAAASTVGNWVSPPDHGDAQFAARVYEASPMKIMSTHMCLPDHPFFHVLRFGTAIAQGQETRSRMRFHIGAELELRYQLQTFGIPVDLIPVTHSGNLKTTYHKQWLKARRHWEAQQEAFADVSGMVIVPRSHDVVFRTGRSLAAHPGNAILQDLIEANREAHAAATSDHDKREITQSIIATIRNEHGGRFLTKLNRGDAWWTVVADPSVVHTKVASTIKELKRKGKSVAAAPQSSPKPRRVVAAGGATSAFCNQDHKRRKLTPAAAIVTDGSSSDSGGSSCDECQCSF